MRKIEGGWFLQRSLKLAPLLNRYLIDFEKQVALQ